MRRVFYHHLDSLSLASSLSGVFLEGECGLCAQPIEGSEKRGGIEERSSQRVRSSMETEIWLRSPGSLSRIYDGVKSTTHALARAH